MNSVSFDFGNASGSIKALHGVCCAPYSAFGGAVQPKIDTMFTQASIPYCRLHDCCGGYGGAHFVDIPNIFPDFDADETDAGNYDFHYTDEYIAAIQRTGCEAYYRLGVTIEWGSKKYTSLPPGDFAKWARICERVIMHYNHGWANGFYYNLKYWEIWNEPENPGNDNGKCMWNGTKEEFYELYAVTSKYLKSKFPDILIGGYGSCGFYELTRDDNPPSYKEFIPYFTDFLKMVKEKECPLDFYSWHIYTGDEKELEAHARYVRETLDSYGFEHTEAHLNEWNIHSEGTGFAGKHTLEGASFNAAVLCMLQNSDYVDKAMYYCFSSSSSYNGFLDQNDGSVCVSWYPFVAFGHLYTLATSVRPKKIEGNIYAVGAKNQSEAAVMIANYGCDDDDVTLDVCNLYSASKAHIFYVTEGKNFSHEFSFSLSEKTEIYFKLPKQSFALIKFE